MKKTLALLLALVLVLGLFGCTNTGNANNTTTNNTTGNNTNNNTNEVKALSYAEYIATALDSDVTIRCYVQAKQGWWEKDGKGVISVYAQDKDGGYFLYEMACSEADAKKLTPGTLIEVTGTKGAWGGLVEVMDATFKFVEGGDTFIAKANDVTNFLGTDDLIKYQNQFVSFKGMTFVKLSYQDETPGKDIYVTFSHANKEYNFCVESYLTGKDTDVYKAVAALKTGDVVDVEGFLYWYADAMNPHITSIKK